jgi:hypothetical protein
MKKNTQLTPIEFKEDNNFLTINGTECFSIIFENEHTHRYAGYKLIEDDIGYCVHIIKIIEEQSLRPNYFSIPLSLALVSLYGKIFAKADGRGIKFQRSDIPQELRETHDLIINYRNNFVAHAGGTHETTISVIGLNPNINNKKVLCVLPPHSVKIDAISLEVREKMIKILDVLKKECATRRSTIYELIKKSVSLMSIETLYSTFKNKATNTDLAEQLPKNENYSVRFHIEPDSKMSFKIEST